MKVLPRIIDLEFLKVRVGVQNFLVIRDAVILDPGGRTDQTIGKPANMSLPVTDEEVEIVDSVAQRSCRCRFTRPLRLPNDVNQTKAFIPALDHDAVDETNSARVKFMLNVVGLQLREFLCLETVRKFAERNGHDFTQV